MNARSLLAVLVVAGGALCSAAFVAIGCSSSSSSSDGTPDSASAGACATQHKAVFQSYCPGHVSLAEITGDCARDCVLMTTKEPPNCVKDCIRTRTGGALDEPCLDCHQALVNCARKYCLAQCVNGPLDLKCLNCMCGNNFLVDDAGKGTSMNCYAPFNACTGLGLTYCEQYDAGKFDAFPPPEDAGACEGGDDATPTDSANDASDAGKG